MANISRRRWMQTSLLASPMMLIASNTLLSKHLTNPAIELGDPLLKLNWNENPYGPSPKAIDRMVSALQDGNRYPDAVISDLKRKLAIKFDVDQEGILITAGSTEILSLLGQHVGLQGGEILTPWPSFPTMMIFGENAGASINKVPLDANDRIDLEKVRSSITNNTRLIFVCNPNNPTSTELESEELLEFCRQVPENVLICVDEAYIEYSKLGTRGSVVKLVAELPNLIVCRTFSKAYGLAGLRIGYAISNKNNITALRLRHTGWELSAGMAAVVAASTTLDDKEFLAMCVAKNDEGKRIVYEAFDNWGVKFNPSSTNFIYAQSKYFDKDVIDKMKAENILLTKWPDMTNHIRISIGKPEEMKQFIEKVEKLLA